MATVLGLRRVNTLLHGNRLAESGLLIFILGAVTLAAVLIRRTLIKRLVPAVATDIQEPYRPSLTVRVHGWVETVAHLFSRK